MKRCVVHTKIITNSLKAHPHAADIEALNRICCVHNTMSANNPSTAEALVHALQFSPYGLSQLLGVNPEQTEDTDVLASYMKGQAKVISALSGKKKKEPKKAEESLLSPFAPPRKDGRVTSSKSKNRRESVYRNRSVSSII